jgi:hypothetical protein
MAVGSDVGGGAAGPATSRTASVGQPPHWSGCGPDGESTRVVPPMDAHGMGVDALS